MVNECGRWLWWREWTVVPVAPSIVTMITMMIMIIIIVIITIIVTIMFICEDDNVLSMIRLVQFIFAGTLMMVEDVLAANAPWS